MYYSVCSRNSPTDIDGETFSYLPQAYNKQDQAVLFDYEDSEEEL